MARERRPNRLPALFLAALLHAGVIGASLIVWPWAQRVTPVEVTPVTLMTSAELAKMAAAQQAETVQEAQVEDPEPAPETTPPAPVPAPVPKPAPAPAPQPKPVPAPTPVPKPAPKPVLKPAEKTPPVKTPTPKTPATKGPSFDLDKLAEQLAKDTRGGPTRSSAPKGPTRPATDAQARPDQGVARASSNTALGAIQAKLIRLWNPNCGLEATANIVVQVRLNLAPDGSLSSPPQLTNGREISDLRDNPTLQNAASRALSAVSRGAPYDNLPREDYTYWKTVIVNFDARKACQ